MNRTYHKIKAVTLNKSQQSGSVMLEALIAILIFSFGILAIVGLQGAMARNTADATYRAEAAYVVQQEMARLSVNPIGLGGNYTKAVSTLPNGSLRTSLLSNSRLQFVVTWQVGNGAQHNYEAVTSMFTTR